MREREKRQHRGCFAVETVAATLSEKARYAGYGAAALGSFMSPADALPMAAIRVADHPVE